MPKKIESEKKSEHHNKVTQKKKESKKLSNAEFEKKVIELAGKGFTSEKIGEQLRQKGIHSKEYGKKISIILKEKNLYINPDLKNIEEKLERMEKHYEKNRQDKRVKYEKGRVFAQLRKFKKYFKVQN